MDNQFMLMVPGPTPVPEPVLLAMAKHPIAHRSDEFFQIMAEVTQNLRWLHQTQHDVLILASSGTGTMEAGMINFLSPGDRVLVGCNGKFGDRWADLAQKFGLQVDTITAEWGQPLDPEQFRDRLAADTNKTIRAVIITHSETSTGVINDLAAINHYVKAHGEALIIVDAVTSLGSVHIPMDDWGLDVVVSASQKGYMMPPGLGFVAVSPKAWQAYPTAKFPRFYLDLGKYQQDAMKHSNPFTPPVNLFFALQAALRMMQAEGLEAIFDRHQRLSQALRTGLQALGFRLFAPENATSPTVTAIFPPDGIEAEAIRAVMKNRFKIMLAGGQDHLKGKILRIGHLGYVSDQEILTAISALEATLLELGHPTFSLGAGVTAAAKVITYH